MNLGSLASIRALFFGFGLFDLTFVPLVMHTLSLRTTALVWPHNLTKRGFTNIPKCIIHLAPICLNYAFHI